MTTITTGASSRFSSVLETPATDPASARDHFAARLSLETDPADVHADQDKGREDFVLVDARTPELYAQEHIRRAINIPYRQINAESTRHLSKGVLVVTYCSGIGCNASTKAALRFAALGFKVKEMVGGLEYWNREGYPVESD